MEEAVATYLKTVAEVRTEHDAQVGELRNTLIGNKRGVNRDAGEREYYKKASPLTRLRDARLAVARAELGVHGDPLAVWMLENCTSYPEHVDAVLKALPLDIDGLRKLGKKEGWCSTFDHLLLAAIRAGVLDDGRVPERRDFDEWVRNTFSVRDSWLVQMNERIDLIVKAEIAAAAAAKKTTKKKAPEAKPEPVEADTAAEQPVLVSV